MCREQQTESDGDAHSEAETLNLAVSCKSGSKCTVQITACLLVKTAASQDQEKS